MVAGHVPALPEPDVRDDYVDVGGGIDDAECIERFMHGSGSALGVKLPRATRQSRQLTDVQ
jgi:hypothetical protein